MRKFPAHLFAALVGSALTISAFSARASENVYTYNGGDNTAFNAISSTDLLEQGAASFSSLTVTDTSDNPVAANTSVLPTSNSGLNDGLSLLSGYGSSAYYAYNDSSNGGSAKANLITGDELGNGGVVITFNLNLTHTGDALGYNIDTINTIAGWQDHASVANQNFTLAYSTVAAPDVFISLPLDTVAYNPNDPTADDSSGGGVATEVSLTDLGLTGVAALQFDFTPDPSSAGYGNSATGIWLQEIDATGSAVLPEIPAPEPSTWAMMLVGAAGVVVLSLRRRVRA